VSSTEGILFVVAGDRYATQAAIAASSVRLAGDDHAIVLITDRTTRVPAAFDAVKRELEPGDFFAAKITALSRSPFERTLFLDADTYVLRPVHELFHVLDRFDVAVAHAPNRSTLSLADVPGSYPELNTGVVAFLRSAVMSDFLDDWLRRYRTFAGRTPASYDQPSFRAACYHSHVRVVTLTPEWNCRFTMGGYLSDPVAILHGWAPEVELKRVARIFNDRAPRRDSFSIYGGGHFLHKPAGEPLREAGRLRSSPGSVVRRVRSAAALRTRVRRARRKLAGFGNGVFIVGMHRSGTSAAARMVNLLGVPIGDPADLIEADPASNPTGHWESRPLAELNDRLLANLGGSWSDPPDLAPGWAAEPPVAKMADEAREAFWSAYSNRPWAWKDPRLCLTLPFWRSVLRTRAAAVLVVRHPLEVARSLEARNSLDVEHALALWETYNRRAIEGLSGLPVFVTTYESLLEDAEWSVKVARFLAGAGLPLRPAAESPDGFLDRGLRHTALDEVALDRPPVTSAQCRLYRLLLVLSGGHPAFRAPDLAAV
jgi:hypothetical protein